jgi:hypothetical protein
MSGHKEQHAAPDEVEQEPLTGAGSQQSVSQKASRAMKASTSSDRLRIGPTVVPRTNAAKSRKCRNDILIILVGIVPLPILSVKRFLRRG